VRTCRRRGPVTARSAGFGISWLVLQIDAELAELDDRRPTPADRVGRERQHERHPVRLAERLAVAQDAVVARRGLDRKPDGFEPADELANVPSSSRPDGRRRRSYRLLSVRDDDAGSPTWRASASRKCDRIDVEVAAGDQP
jgi:hypothetical protein